MDTELEQKGEVKELSEEEIKEIDFKQQYNKCFKDSDLTPINKQKLTVIQIIIIVLILILISLIGTRGVLFCLEQKNIANYKNLIKNTQTKVIQFEQEEIERQRIKAEQELREKLAKRNIKDLTSEQITNIKNIYSNSDKKIAYITFDDGPSVSVTPLVLDILAQENIKATFFVLGINARWYPEILKRIREEGHYIANHGYTHKYEEIYINFNSLINEYNLCEQAIRDALGENNYKTRIFRFPGGSTGGKYHNIKNEAKVLLEQQGIVFMDWNSLTGDSQGIPTKESIMETLKSTSQNKNILVVLMHDAGNKILTYETLPEVISYLKEQGYEFGDIYDIIGE